MARQRKTDTHRKAQKIASEGSDVREQVRRLTVEAMGNRKLELARLEQIAREVIDGAMEGAKSAMPREKDSVLRQVVDGLADAYGATANAVGLAFEHTRDRGRELADVDVKRILKDLQAMEKRYVESVSKGFRSVRKQASSQAKDFNAHARRAAKKISPCVASATGAAGHSPVQLVGESATTGLRASRRAAGVMAMAMSGFLQGAAEFLSEPGPGKPRKKTGKKTKKKAKTAKSAKKKTAKAGKKVASRKKAAKKRATRKVVKKAKKKTARKR